MVYTAVLFNFAPMKSIEFKTVARVYDYAELSNEHRSLVDAAKEATRNSYAPYSQFHVGAAILMDNGSVTVGSNQENAAYPSGLCAERTAAFHASSAFPGVAMRKIAIAARTQLHKPEGLPFDEYFQNSPISPCGACRQALLEYETLYGPMEVILYGRNKTVVFDSVASLLPYSFTEF